MLILPDYLLTFLIFLKIVHENEKNLPQNVGSSEPPKLPLDPPLTCFCCRDLDQHRMMTITNHLQREVDLLILPDYLLIFLDFSENYLLF